MAVPGKTRNEDDYLAIMKTIAMLVVMVMLLVMMATIRNLQYVRRAFSMSYHDHRLSVNLVL